jgi:2-methylcitrate dehydratase PrpD
VIESNLENMSQSTESSKDIDTRLASFVADLSFTDIPEPAVRSAERAFVDTVGVTLAGAAEGAGETAIKAIGALTSDCAGVKVLGTDQEVPATDAAFLNATAGHGLDFDDVTWGVWHPSVPLVAPILAAAEDIGTDGERAIAGYVAGFETQVFLAEALLPAHYERGWHATATFGTFGAAAAVATLLDLDTERTRHALNVTASMPAGLKHNFGSMTKPMHAGQAARSGLTAAYLAADGFTAADNAIGAERGFCDLYGGDADPSIEELPSLGERWGLIEDGIQVKKFPCCYFTHTSIAAALALRANHDLRAEDVASVRVTASQGAADALHYKDPETGLEGKFSMHYPVAVALVTGEVGLAAFDDENVDDPAVQSTRERVTFEVDPDLPYDPFKTTVQVETTNGETHERVQDEPPGTPADPLSDAELREKFEMCAARVPIDVDAGAAYETLDTLRDRDEVVSVLARL